MVRFMRRVETGGKKITNIGMLFTGFPIHWVNDLELYVCDLRYISPCCNKPRYMSFLYNAHPSKIHIHLYHT